MAQSSFEPVFCPIVQEFTPAPDAWSVAQSLGGRPGLLFLDSAQQDAVLGRYSFVAAGPFLTIRSWRRKIELVEGQSKAELEGDPFIVLQQNLRRFRLETLPDLPRFQGGAAGLLGYDLCHHIERLPRPRFAEFPIPDLAINFYGWVIAFDHARKRAWVIANGFPATDPAAFVRKASERLESVRQALASTPRGESSSPAGTKSPRVSIQAPQEPVRSWPAWTSNFSRAAYLGMVRRAVEYTHAGDCFQVNLAQRLLAPLKEEPLAIYGRLRQCNPAPFAGYFDAGDYVLASASPERFLRVENGQVETRPIKGTRPRGFTPEEDFARADDLRTSAKDRAENVMIVDLLRNDLGRVCEYGSIKVAALCRLERFPFVHHLVSEVRGRLRQGLDNVELLRATFPGGSVTGAPKVRAMEIITELEQTARGPYCGCLGYYGFDGAMDSNLLIRTLVLGGGWVQLSVGGGIVADSVSEREYEETWHKAEGMLRALET